MDKQCPECGSNNIYAATDDLSYEENGNVIFIEVDNILCFDCHATTISQTRYGEVPIPMYPLDSPYFIEFEDGRWLVIDSSDGFPFGDYSLCELAVIKCDLLIERSKRMKG